MKNVFQAGLIIIGVLAWIGCSSVKPDELSRLKAENQSLMSQIDTLNEKLSIMNALENQTADKKKKEIANLNENYSNLLITLDEERAAGIIKVSEQQNIINIESMDKIFFDSGSAEIKEDGKKSLDKMAMVLKKIKDNSIRVEGYTDDIPIAESYKWKYPSNWELSTARADSIVQYLKDRGVDPAIMKAIGYGRYNPAASNDTEKGRTQNRRIIVQVVPFDIQAK